VPADNQAFQDFALGWWRHQPSINGYWTEREHTRQWDNTSYWQDHGWDYCGTDPSQADGEIYNEATCARIKAVIDGLLDLYFPGGRPSTDAGDDMITWSGQPVQLDPNVIPDLTYAWSADPVDGVEFDPNEFVEAPTVTITKPADGVPVTAWRRITRLTLMEIVL